MSSRRIWLCADDYGISPAVGVAIRDLIVRGRLNAASVMVAAPGFHRDEACALAALAGGETPVAIGLHLALTAPFRPRTAKFAPREAEAFLPLGRTLAAACLHRFSGTALRAEITAQLGAFRDVFGHAPDFVDGHQHVHLFPQLGEAVLDVVKDVAPTAWLRQCGRVLPLTARMTDRKGLLLDLLSRRFRDRAAARGLRTNPGFAGTYDFGTRPDFAALFARFLERLPDGGVIMCHPGFVDAELQRLDPLTTLREQEYAFLAGETFPAVLARAGVTLAWPRRGA